MVIQASTFKTTTVSGSLTVTTRLSFRSIQTSSTTTPDEMAVGVVVALGELAMGVVVRAAQADARRALGDRKRVHVDAAAAAPG